MFKLLMAVILGLFLVSAPGGFSPAYAQAVAVCTGTLTFPWGGSNDYEFRLVFSRWDGKLIVKGDSESFQFLNDGSATVHAITGQVFVSPKDKKAYNKKNGVPELKVSLWVPRVTSLPSYLGEMIGIPVAASFTRTHWFSTGTNPTSR